MISRMIRICSKSSNLFKPAKFLSSSSAKFTSNTGHDASDRSSSGQSHTDRLDKRSNPPIKLTNEHLNNPDKLKKLLRCDQPVEGEPVPPSKNPYINLKDVSLKAFRPEGIDESQASFFMFPGQGSQYVGMGRKLLETGGNRRLVENMFKTASNILGYDLEEVCLQGPQTKLDQTLYAQPAIFVTSLAGKLIA